MKFLLMGGPVFLGRHLIDAALARGHEVTLFNRGRHNPELYPEIEKLRGDRRGDLTALRGRRWDAVIDTSGYVPSVVRRSAQALVESAAHYTFISSISAYAQFDRAGTDESAPVAGISAERLKEAEEIEPNLRITAQAYGEIYGALKALCERAAEETMPGRVLNIRPGLIVGPHDYSDRFTYWVHRVAQGGEVLAPGRPERRVRMIDARDLAAWIVFMAEGQRTGLYNATGAEDGLTMKGMLDQCKRVSGSDARFVWASESFLLEHEVEAWSELPLWLPEERNGIFAVNNERAVAAGLTFRSLAETIEATLAWDAARPADAELSAGMKQEREQLLLQALPHPQEA